jgi:hypothetical protein
MPLWVRGSARATRSRPHASSSSWSLSTWLDGRRLAFPTTKSYRRGMQRRDPMIDIHVRISRKLVIALVVIFIVLPLIWLVMQTLGSSSH